MKLENPRKVRSRQQLGKELVHPVREKRVFPPAEILTPDVVAGVLQVKKEMEGVMIGEPTDSYVSFLAAARLVLPEQEKLLQPKGAYTIDRKIRGETGHLKNLDFTKFSFEVMKLREYALLKPNEVGEALRPALENILKAIEHEFQGERTYLAVSLVMALWVSIPESRDRLKIILDRFRLKLLKEGREEGWDVPANLCLIDQEYRDAFEPSMLFETGRSEILKELPHLLGKPMYGDPGHWTSVLNGVFALAVTTASEVQLQENGTVRYHFAQKPNKAQPLPERLEV